MRVRLVTFIILLLLSHPTFSAEQPLDKVILQLHWKHQFEFAGFYAAKAQGYYQEVGLELEMKENEDGVNVSDAVLAGKANYGISSTQIVIDRLNQLPVVLLASYFKQNALALVTRSGIKTPTDLIGQKVMFGTGQLEKTSIGLMLQEYNIPFNSINEVPHSYNPQDFIEGKVDAMTVFLSNEMYQIEQSGIAYNVLNPAEFGIYSMDVNLFSSEEEVKNHPERIKRFLKATKKGWHYALRHQEEIVDLILAEYSQVKSKQALLYEAKKTKELIKPDLYDIGLVIPEIIAFTYGRFCRVYGLSKKGFDKKFIFNQQIKLQLTRQEKAYLEQKNQQLNLCVDPDFMPYEKLEDGKHQGMVADFMTLFSHKLDVTFVIPPTLQTWTDALRLGKQRQCDLFSLIMETPERKKYLDFTQTYIEFPLVVATRYEQIYIADIEQIIDKPLGVKKDYAYIELLRLRHPAINLFEVDTLEEGLDKVVSKELFGMIGSVADVAYAFQTSYVGELKIAGKLDEIWGLSIAVRNDEPLLKSIFDKVIAQMSVNEKQDIMSRWIAISYEKGMDYAFLFRLLSIVIFCFGGFLYYHFKFRKYTHLLEHQSITDRLTAINNRLKLDQEIERSLSLAGRYKVSFSLILIDIDFFKKINDEYGHLVGDSALKEVAKLLSDNIRNVDTAGRWGGEEFLIICPEQINNGAIILAEKLRVVIDRHLFKDCLHLSCSFGVSSYQESDTVDMIMQRADEALYRAKVKGRNQVCVG